MSWIDSTPAVPVFYLHYTRTALQDQPARAMCDASHSKLFCQEKNLGEEVVACLLPVRDGVSGKAQQSRWDSRTPLCLDDI